jgi:hypothetical protein
MKKILILITTVMVLTLVVPAVQAKDYRAWWNSYWSEDSSSFNSNPNHNNSWSGGHHVASIQRLPGNKGFLVVLEDGRVVTVDPSGKIVDDNNKGRLAEKAIPWAAILGIVGILVH